MKNNDNKVSVLIPVYQEPLNFVKDSILSIQKQTYKNIEILVGVDDPNNYENIDFLKSVSAQFDNFRLFVN